MEQSSLQQLKLSSLDLKADKVAADVQFRDKSNIHKHIL